MMEQEASFIWSDSWWIENDVAWFVGGRTNALYRLDRKTKQCEFVAMPPELASDGFRLNPRCIKCGDDIFMMPDISSSIWVYHIAESRYEQIRIANPDKARTGINNFWQCGEKIFAVSTGLKQVIEIDIRERRITDCWNLCDRKDIKTAMSVKVGTAIYTVSAVSGEIYKFDIQTKESISYELSGIEDGLHTICFDGEKFWLSGYRKEIYVWDEDKNRTVCIEGFPEDFGLYNFDGTGESLLDCESSLYEKPLFTSSVASKQDVWFIPFQTNKIVYVNRETYELFVFDIEEENETMRSLSLHYLADKYLMEYVVDDCCIGLYSLKNYCIIEIDTIEKKVEKKEYSFSNSCLKSTAQVFDRFKNFVLFEGREIENRIFAEKLLAVDANLRITESESVGWKIFKEMTLTCKHSSTKNAVSGKSGFGF
nr:hypothetical protein [uncultured Acetatifactor sp.]